MLSQSLKRKKAMIELTFTSDDGLRIFAYDFPSFQSLNYPAGVIILLHGLAEHSGRYTHLVRFFNENNMAVISMDLRGHGFSEGKRVFIPTLESIYRDIDLLIERAKFRYSSCPAILYGHSMGGTLALSYTLKRYPNATDECPYQGIIVSSPWIRLAGRLQPPRPISGIIKRFSQRYPSLRFPLRFNIAKITHDQEVIDDYSTDPQIGRSVTLSLVETVGSVATMLDRSSCVFHIPVLIQHGSSDAITSPRASSRFAERGKNIKFKGWPEFFHELHNEVHREEVFKDLLQWIQQEVFN